MSIKFVYGMSTTTPEYRGCTKFHYEMYHYHRLDREYLYRCRE